VRLRQGVGGVRRRPGLGGVLVMACGGWVEVWSGSGNEHGGPTAELHGSQTVGPCY
jgi:hypothetical protein